MAMAEADLAGILGDLIGSDTYARNEAQGLYDAIPLEKKMHMLLDMIQNMGGEEAFRAAVARHFADLVAFSFVEFFKYLAPSEQKAFLESFFNCLQQWITVERVREELCAAFADMARKLLKKPQWGLCMVIMDTFWKFVQHEEVPFRVAGWSMLARFPMLIYPELTMVLQLLKRDISSEEKAGCQAATSCFLTLFAEFWNDNSELQHLLPLLGDALLAVGRFLMEGDNGLLEQLNTCGELCLGFIENHQCRVVSMCLQCIGKPESDKKSRILCLKLLRKLLVFERGSLQQIARVVYHAIVRELSTSVESLETGETGLESDLFLALEDFYSDMRNDFNIGEFLPDLVLSGTSAGPIFACRAAIMIAAAGGQAPPDHAAISCLWLAISESAGVVNSVELAQGLWQRRVGNYVVNTLYRQEWIAGEGLTLGPTVRLDARQFALLEKQQDPVVRSLTYKRHMEFADSAGTWLHDLREDLPFWEGILEMELRHLIRMKLALPLATALKAVSVIFRKYLEPLESEELRRLFSLLKTVSSFNNLGHAFTANSDFQLRVNKGGKGLVDRDNAAQLAMAAVSCALTVASPMEPAAVSCHVDWIVDALANLQPPEGPGGFNDHQLGILHNMSSAWLSVLRIYRKDEAVLSRIVPQALDSILREAAAYLPIEVVEDCLEVRAAPEEGMWSYYPMGNRRFAKVLRKGLESKCYALGSLWRFMRVDSPRFTADPANAVSWASERQPLLDATSVIVDMMIAGFASDKHIRRALGCDEPSRRAAACFMLLFPKRLDVYDGRFEKEHASDSLNDEDPGTLRRAMEVCEKVEPFLVEMFQRPTSDSWCNHSFCVLIKSVQYLPQQRVAAHMPNILSFVSRALEHFPSSPTSTGTAADMEDLDDNRELKGQAGAPRTIASLLRVMPSKCTQEEAEQLFDLMAEHCEHLCGIDASLECLSLGLEILFYWLSDFPSAALRRMDWMFSHLVHILERLGSEVRRCEPEYRPDGFPNTRRLHVVFIDQLMEDTARSLALLAPFYEQDVDAMGRVLVELTDIRRAERKNTRDMDILVWTSFAILAILKRAMDSGCGLSAEVLSQALREALTDHPLPHAITTCPQLYKDLVDLYWDVRLPSRVAKGHIAIMANLSLARRLAVDVLKNIEFLTETSESERDREWLTNELRNLTRTR